ncbi:MAG: MBL fold metallo-hydrolase [Candidatus Riflebacteria bacterium]|nr:MBL fold metallo-hydrolase [Candidatus Riflebacteria bacterium]
MFGVVPRVIWAKSHPPDDSNRIRLALRPLLIRGHGRTILVDAGIGQKFPQRQREMYGVDHGHGDLIASLGAVGVRVEDVTDLVVTHLHFDHVGGATRKEQDGRVVPTFPNALVHVQRVNWEWAVKPNLREKASYLDENVRPHLESGRLRLLDGPCDLLPGIRVEVSDGHTRGQQLVIVSSGRRTLFYAGDLIPTSTHLKIPYTMGYDIEPLRLMEEKQMWLSRAAAEGWIVFFEHDPAMAACTVQEGPGGFSVKSPIDLTAAV